MLAEEEGSTKEPPELLNLLTVIVSAKRNHRHCKLVFFFKIPESCRTLTLVDLACEVFLFRYFSSLHVSCPLKISFFFPVYKWLRVFRTSVVKNL